MSSFKDWEKFKDFAVVVFVVVTTLLLMIVWVLGQRGAFD